MKPRRRPDWVNAKRKVEQVVRLNCNRDEQEQPALGLAEDRLSALPRRNRGLGGVTSGAEQVPLVSPRFAGIADSG